jgi:eukaryotic-like serine/threonine-protein kinase
VVSWEQLSQLFDEARTLSPSQRVVYLNRICVDNASLRAELERLLDAHDHAGDFMNNPIVRWSSSTVSTSPPVFSAGEKVAGRFRIICFLGAGGMGQVYQAEDEVLGGFVALKTIRPEIALDQRTFERFKQEVSLAKKVTHDNVCRVFDLDHNNVPPYITMELVEGETLSARLHRGGKITPPEALPLIDQMAAGLQAAHRKSVIHGDFKPGNVMLVRTSDGATLVKITDFGLARTADQEGPSLTRPVGTVAYMAPEQLAGGKATVASDIYALGLVMYEMITGTKPGHDRMNEMAPSPSKKCPHLDDKLAAAILRCLERDPARRFSTAADVPLAIRGKTSLVDRIKRWIRIHPAASAAAVLAILLVAAILLFPPASNLEKVYSQLTTDPGLSSYPAISPDGKWMAYASDRGGEGNLDIWLRQIDGDNPIRRTKNPADDYDPTFSAEGTKIAFRSERDGGGIYLLPMLEGEPQLLVRGGYGPRFSPDGNWITYWEGMPGSGFVPGSSRVYVKPTSGGPARPLATGLAAAFWPVWAPDSRRLLVIGRPNIPGESSVTVDWWIVPLAGGPPTKAFALPTFRAQHLAPPLGQENIAPIAWSPDNRILFSAMQGDTANLWDVAVSSAGKVIGPAVHRTLTTSLDLYASVSNGPLRRMLFSSLAGAVNVWSLPINANTGRVKGEMENLTKGESYTAAPSISANGRNLVFIASRSKTYWSLKTRDLETGKEDILASADASWFRARISPDAGTIAYVDNSDRMYAVNTLTGANERICEHCGPPTDVGPDGQTILFEPLLPPEDVMMIEVSTHRIVSMVHSEKADDILYQGRYSPDGRWVAFLQATAEKPLNTRVFISPIRDGRALARDGWIPVTDGSQIDNDVVWSPDGNLLYFTSQRDGSLCVWAQQLKRTTKQPAGPAFAVRHFHNPRQSLARVDRKKLIGMSVASGKLVFAMSELTGNIWMEERKTPSGAEWLTRWMPSIFR